MADQVECPECCGSGGLGAYVCPLCDGHGSIEAEAQVTGYVGVPLYDSGSDEVKKRSDEVKKRSADYNFT